VPWQEDEEYWGDHLYSKGSHTWSRGPLTVELTAAWQTSIHVLVSYMHIANLMWPDHFFPFYLWWWKKGFGLVYTHTSSSHLTKWQLNMSLMPRSVATCCVVHHLIQLPVWSYIWTMCLYGTISFESTHPLYFYKTK